MGPNPVDSANGIRTRVWALRGPRPSPLDDSAVRPHCASRTDPQARQESNLQPPVLETGALPIELRTFGRPGWLTGIEPATSGATVRRSNQLSYNHHATSAPTQLLGAAKRGKIARGQRRVNPKTHLPALWFPSTNRPF